MTVPAHTNTTTAAEVLAAHVLDEYANECSCKRWKHFEDPYDVRIASFAQHQVDVLARDGLLADPTTRTEWGVACPLDGEVEPCDYAETADATRLAAAHHDRNCGPGHRAVRRTVTDWTPAEEGEHG
jgi:hypothetical protein